MTDRYENIRRALAMGPTPGPFSAVRSYSHGNQELIIRLTCNDEYGITENYCTVHNRLGDERKTEANAAYIAACDPDTIRALLAERDQLAAAIEALRAGVQSWRPTEGEKIMVSTPYDVFILPLRPSGLDGNGPRFVVHVPGPEQPAPQAQSSAEAWRDIAIAAATIVEEIREIVGLKGKHGDVVDAVRKLAAG